MSKKTTTLKSTSGTKEDKLVRITFDAPASLRKSFKLKAAQEERSLKDVFCELMECYVKNNEPEK
jgi:hypothetical protein